MCVKDVMTPRSEVDVMDLTAPFEENWELARNPATPGSRWWRETTWMK